MTNGAKSVAEEKNHKTMIQLQLCVYIFNWFVTRTAVYAMQNAISEKLTMTFLGFCFDEHLLHSLYLIKSIVMMPPTQITAKKI